MSPRSTGRWWTQLSGECPWREISGIADAVEQVKTAYRDGRHALLAQERQELEAVRAAIKRRDGFSLLTGEQAAHVLQAVEGAMPTTDEHTIAPSLEQLSGRFGPALSAAAKEANQRLDALLSKSGAPIRQVQANLKDREIKDAEELERVLDEIRTRVLEQLKAGCRAAACASSS